MKSIVLLLALAGVLPASLAAVDVRAAAKVHRVVYLTDGLLGPADPKLIDAFRDELRRLGYVEGQNLAFERRHATRPEDRPAVAVEIHALKPHVVVTDPVAVYWSREALRPFPVVFPTYSDPVGAGLAVSLARPGGNVTGLSYAGMELNAKRLELLKDAFPGIARVGALASLKHPTLPQQEREVRTAAERLRIQLTVAEVDQSDPAESAAGIDAAFETFRRQRVDAVIALQGPGLFKERRRIAELALKHRLPTMFDVAPYVEAGGLMSYAPDLAALQRRAAAYVHRILNGATPAELPIEQPTKFELLVNARVARALGVSIAPALLARADRVIE